MKLSVLQLFFIFAILQGLALCSLLALSRYFRSKANFYLAFCFAVVVVMGFIYWLIAYGYNPPFMIVLNDIMWEYLFPVPFLLYTLHATTHPEKDNHRWNFLYIPFVATLLINLIADFDIELHLYSIFTPEGEKWLDRYYIWEDIGTWVFALAVFLYALKIILASRGTPAYRWSIQMWAVCMVIIVFWVASWLIEEFWGLDLVSYLWASLNLLFFWVNIKGISQFKLAEDQFEIRSKQRVQPNILERPQTLPNADCGNPYFERLEKAMQAEKLFRDSSLNRDMVAEKLGISSGYLSQVVNSCTHHNFSDYVNAYRVKEVKVLLENPEFSRYSLLAIGLEAGFNSKSTYFAVFKKMAGMTPSEYKNTLS